MIPQKSKEVIHISTCASPPLNEKLVDSGKIGGII
jgi:hypothetical protein